MRKFHARCRLKRPVPYDQVPDDVRSLVDADVLTPGRIKSRWDRKLGANVVDLPCDHEFTDPDLFEQHMRDVHGRKSRKRAVWSTPSSELPYTTTPRWKPPRLLDEGRPWVADDGRTAKCRGCGFVVELSSGSTQVIDEHKATCADRDVA